MYHDNFFSEQATVTDDYATLKRLVKQATDPVGVQLAAVLVKDRRRVQPGSVWTHTGSDQGSTSSTLNKNCRQLYFSHFHGHFTLYVSAGINAHP